MDGENGSSTARQVRVGASRAALVAVIALMGLLALPGVASANWKVAPFVDCHLVDADGSQTLILGYTNSFKDGLRVPLGKKNALYPSRLQGVQPTVFDSGTVRGALTVRLTAAELRAGARWELEGYVLDLAAAARGASSCPPSSELPEEGNGTGPAIALAAAGVIGGVMVHRANRRARALS